MVGLFLGDVFGQSYRSNGSGSAYRAFQAPNGAKDRYASRTIPRRVRAIEDRLKRDPCLLRCNGNVIRNLDVVVRFTANEGTDHAVYFYPFFVTSSNGTTFHRSPNRIARELIKACHLIAIIEAKAVCRGGAEGPTCVQASYPLKRDRHSKGLMTINSRHGVPFVRFYLVVNCQLNDTGDEYES